MRVDELQWPFASWANLCTRTSGATQHFASAETRVDSFPMASEDPWNWSVN